MPFLYQLSIIPTGDYESTYHARKTANSLEEAVDLYINEDPTVDYGARAAQRRGGIVLVREVLHDDPPAMMYAYGVRLYKVAPPPPKPRAVIIEHLTG